MSGSIGVEHSPAVSICVEVVTDGFDIKRYEEGRGGGWEGGEMGHGSAGGGGAEARKLPVQMMDEVTT